VQLERVQTPVLDARAQQTLDRLKALAASQLDAPTRANPQPVLLVVDRHHPPRAARLGQERVKAVEGPDVEHAQAVETRRQGRDAVAVVPRHARRVQAGPPVERKRVKPQGHTLHDSPRVGGVGLDGQQIRHLTLGRRGQAHRVASP
jgi:hypothetical protein